MRCVIGREGAGETYVMQKQTQVVEDNGLTVTETDTERGRARERESERERDRERLDSRPVRRKGRRFISSRSKSERETICAH